MGMALLPLTIVCMSCPCLHQPGGTDSCTCCVGVCAVCLCRCLRAFRALLFTEDTALARAACLQDMPPGLVLLHAFSRWVGGCVCGERENARVQEGLYMYVSV
jgi:hypothetical protein